jgi:hypothetical protein
MIEEKQPRGGDEVETEHFEQVSKNNWKMSGKLASLDQLAQGA